MKNVFVHDQTIKTRRELFLVGGFAIFFALTHGDFDSLRILGNDFQIRRAELTWVLAIAVSYLLIRFLIMVWDDYSTFSEAEVLEDLNERITETRSKIAKERVSLTGLSTTTHLKRDKREMELNRMLNRLSKVKQKRQIRRIASLIAECVPATALAGFALVMLYVSYGG